jgi:hypothetical protein
MKLDLAVYLVDSETVMEISIINYTTDIIGAQQVVALQMLYFAI